MRTEDSSNGRYKWGVVALLFCIGALNYCDRVAIAAVYPLIRTDLGASDVGLAAIGTVFLWTYGFSSPFAGAVSDRRSRSRVVVLSLSLWSLITLATAFVADLRQLLLTRIGLGLVEAAYLPAAMALIADHHSTRTRATAISIHTAGLSFGLVAGGSVAGFLGQHFGWRSSFVLLGGGGLFLAAIAHLFLRDAGEPAAGPASPAAAPIGGRLTRLGRIPTYLLILIWGMAAALGNNIFINWLPLYFNETYGMSLGWAGFSGTFFIQGAATAAMISGGVFSDRIAGRRPRRRMAIQIICGLAAAPFLTVFFAGHPAVGWLFAGILGFSFLQKFGDANVSPLICDLLPPRLRATAFGVQNMANTLAGGLAVMAAGMLKGRIGLGAVFGGISATTLLGAAILGPAYFIFLPRDLRRSRSG